MLQGFFEWMQGLGFSQFILQETWASPIVQCVHLVSLVVFSGAILVVDVRLLGRGLTSTPLPKLAREAEKWMIGGFLALLVSGIPQVMSTALKEYYSPFFWWKMQLIGVGLVYTFTVRRRVALAEEGSLGNVWPKLIGVVSMAIWTGVAVWARLIGLLS